MSNNKFTVKQHFVPRTYLSGFTYDNIHTYVYDLEGEIPIGKAIPIDTICYRDNLYELTDENGFLLRNFYEKQFSKIESFYSEYRKHLTEKCKLAKQRDVKYKGFLTDKEKAFWYYYICLQLCRHPSFIDLAKEEAQKLFKMPFFSDDFKSNIATIICLPGSDFLPSCGESIFTILLKCIAKLKFFIYYDFSDSIISSDYPISAHTLDDTVFGLDELIFPVSSNIVIVLKRYDKLESDSFVLPIDDESKLSTLQAIGYVANRFVFSKIPLSNEDYEIIKKEWHTKNIEKRI